MSKRLGSVWLYTVKIRRHAAQANSFVSGALMLRRIIPHAVTTHLNAARPCSSSYVAMRFIAAP